MALPKACKTVIVEKEAPGGQAGLSSRIENYLGFPSGLSGSDLARRAVAQAKRFGVEILAPQEVAGARVEGPYKIVTLADGSEFSCHALLIATGVQWRKLDVPGIERLQGAGVYYGAAVHRGHLLPRTKTSTSLAAPIRPGRRRCISRVTRGECTMLVRGESLSAPPCPST